MQREEPFAVGAEVVWRSRPGGDIGYVFGCRVLLDEPDVAAVVQPTGSTVTRRSARRGGPKGRSLLPGTWDGSRQRTTWERLPCVRLHPIGRSYAVIRTWVAEDQRFAGWYVNLEQPWTRTAVGFDTRDDVLDVTVSEDLSEYELKDADELQFSVAVGLFTQTEADGIHATAEAAVADVANRRWPFDEEAWTALSPHGLLEAAGLPEGWDTE